MNGAQSLIRTLVAGGVEVCFANPGTSEMHFVAALDDVPEMRGVLALFEGVVTGAADGYGRMADKPAATLLHLGSGLGNGLANLHNTRRAHTPVVNIVGDHATYHKQYDAPLDSDIETVARNVSGWVRTSARPADIATDAADAMAAAVRAPGQVATLILPADVSWLEAGEPAAPLPPAARHPVPAETVTDIAQVLSRGEPVALFVGGSVLRERGLIAAARVAAVAGTKVLAETFPARLERGAGLPPVERLGYLAEFAALQFDGLTHLVIVDAKPPVSFFAYPGKASDLVPDGCQVHVLASGADDAVAALEALADELGAAPDAAVLQPAGRPDRPTGALNARAVGDALGALLPEGAIVADEGQTAGLFASGCTAGAPRHDWLTLCGGAIGMGLPLATGAAVACPDRKVIALEADGSAMYTIQSLWTQAREGLDVTTIILANRAYAILDMELDRVGAVGTGGAGAAGRRAAAMLDISRPNLDFVSLAAGMGVTATRAHTAEEFTEQLEAALGRPGPNLIEAILPRSL